MNYSIITVFNSPFTHIDPLPTEICRSLLSSKGEVCTLNLSPRCLHLQHLSRIVTPLRLLTHYYNRYIRPVFRVNSDVISHCCIFISCHQRVPWTYAFQNAFGLSVSINKLLIDAGGTTPPPGFISF